MLLVYKGIYNISTNTPILTDGVGILGDTYIVNVDNGLFIANRDLGSGPKSFAVYSYIIYNGSTWNSSLNI